MKRMFFFVIAVAAAAGCAAMGDGTEPVDQVEGELGLGPPHDLGGPITITNNQTGQCWDVISASLVSGTHVATTACNGGRNQQWLMRYHPACLTGSPTYLVCSDVIFINVNSGLCLDVPGGVFANGLQQYTCNYGTNQRFSVGSLSGSPGGLDITTLIDPNYHIVSPGAQTNLSLVYGLPRTNLGFWTTH
jgi:hypothetical protein